MKITFPFTLFVFLLSGIISYSQTTNTVVKALIQMEKTEGSIKITGTAENLSDIVQSFSYKLSVIKKSTKGTNQSNNAQEGLSTLAPNERKNLSTTQVNLSSEDEVIILLLFYNENKQLIGKDRLALGDEKKKNP